MGLLRGCSGRKQKLAIMNKVAKLIIVIIISLQPAFAQSDVGLLCPIEKCNPPIPYDSVKIKPAFGTAGYVELFSRWLRNNVRYPAMALEFENEIYGTVHVWYIIEKDGSINEVEVINDADSILSREVLRVIRAQPRVTPGKQQIANHAPEFQPVRVLMTAKVHFVLDDYIEKVSDDVDINITVMGLRTIRRSQYTINVRTVRPTFWQRIRRLER